MDKGDEVLTNATVIADSISKEGIRLTTFNVTFPRYILAEVNTHRALSRNYASSRAIPTAKLVERVRRESFKPIKWAQNITGMQAGAELPNDIAAQAEVVWKEAATAAALCAEKLVALNVHKQWAGRLVEPFVTVTGIITATDWANFFALRTHEDAQPEFRALAVAMKRAHEESAPTQLEPGEWHLPYVGVEDFRPLQMASGQLGVELLELAKKVSTARCARVSYLNHDGSKPSIEKDLALYERLAGSTPIHASPLEHQATPDTCRDIFESPTLPGGEIDYGNCEIFTRWNNPNRHGNLTGWIQNRKLIPNEAAHDRRKET